MSRQELEKIASDADETLNKVKTPAHTGIDF